MASTSQRSTRSAFFSHLYLGSSAYKLRHIHHHKCEMIEMQALALTTDRRHTLSVSSTSDSSYMSSGTPIEDHDTDTGAGASFLSSVSSWLTTSSATISSVVQDLADDLEMSDSLSSGISRVSLGASLVAEVSLVAAKAATLQALSVVDMAVMSILDTTNTSSTHVMMDTCQGRGCNGTCCSTAEILTDADILAAVEDLRVQDEL
ncbi:hypothetical protein F503_07577 [Ophiostoma piceae UAMH 11346]|uniref:Uncharacterized protein n=1 Tax=Ophiostoma piceae (strain UAMH 11346) TaxID=1262450 RepID=S3CCS5_OPHP1|nr:hypothetical protein F503_07577 [Ophiostoma piceae UAMH 11346]